MKLFLASPHTFLKFRGGQRLAECAIGGFFENLPCGQHDISAIYRSDALRGGFSVNENLPCRSDSLWTEGQHRGGFDQTIKKWRPYILESFYYADADTERLLPHFGDFMLDSGAFTFCGTGANVAWEEYVERYADFINRNNVQKFFELDIDSVVGYEEVKRLRAKLERLTGRQCIPVWHNNRGKDEYINHTKEYPYVAIGGLVGGKSEYDRRLWKFFPWFIDKAHENGAKLHALGFTSLDGITQYHFDSVDSTAWTAGNRFGFIYRFDGKTMRKIDVPKGYRIKDSRRLALINYTEWIKFQKYAETHL